MSECSERIEQRSNSKHEGPHHRPSTSAGTIKLKGQSRKITWCVWQVLADKSRTKRPKKTKIGKKIVHPRAYNAPQIQGQRSWSGSGAVSGGSRKSCERGERKFPPLPLCSRYAPSPLTCFKIEIQFSHSQQPIEIVKTTIAGLVTSKSK